MCPLVPSGNLAVLWCSGHVVCHILHAMKHISTVVASLNISIYPRMVC
jgi:hypothetical protein